MFSTTARAACLVVLFLFTCAGCTTTGGSGGGWVVVGQPQPSPPPPQKKTPKPQPGKENRGQERAARNSLRNAYRFLEKGKPDHAMKELEKARSRMGENFWFHYYMGGAYYFKGMYDLADDSFRLAYRYTADYRLRSRLRTCQSFAIAMAEGEHASRSYLRMATDIDQDNRVAWELLRELGDTEDDSRGAKPSKPSFKGARDGDDRYRDAEDRGDGEPEEYAGPGEHQDRNRDQGKGRKEKTGRDRGKKEKPKKIRDKDRFREYFLVEMP